MRRAIRVATRVGLALALVLAATAILVAGDADLAFASVVLLLAVVGSSTLGYAAGLLAALVSASALTYYFTPPAHSFTIDQPDDVLALVAFVAVSLLVAASVARLNQLRLRSELGAREARIRLTFTNALSAGMPTSAVVDTVAHQMVDVFELAECRIDTGHDRATASGDRPSVGTSRVSTGHVTFSLELGRALEPGEHDTLEALAAGLVTALDRVRLDVESREQRVRADLDRSRAGFLTAITHDLRTPIATIKGATGALLADDSQLEPDERRELLEAVYDESARLENLVTKVLELTRIRTGAIQPEPVAVAAPDLVQAAVDHLGPAGRARQIELEFDPDLPALHVDVLLLEHVLTNLLENALVHDPSGQSITVRGTTSAGVLELAVIDHGPGIPVRDRQRVYREFVRLRAPTDGPGTGLGLAIVQALVTANDGHVRYEDTPGGGATFVLTLPTTIDDPECEETQ